MIASGRSQAAGDLASTDQEGRLSRHLGRTKVSLERLIDPLAVAGG